MHTTPWWTSTFYSAAILYAPAPVCRRLAIAQDSLAAAGKASRVLRIERHGCVETSTQTLFMFGGVICTMSGSQVQACERGERAGAPASHQTPVTTHTFAPDVLNAPLAGDALRVTRRPAMRSLGATSMEASYSREGLDEHGIPEQPAGAKRLRSAHQVIEIGDESDTDDSKQEVCSICRQAILDQWKCETPCGHTYHYRCIDAWVKLKEDAARCPICRRAAQPLVHVICDL